MAITGVWSFTLFIKACIVATGVLIHSTGVNAKLYFRQMLGPFSLMRDVMLRFIFSCSSRLTLSSHPISSESLRQACSVLMFVGFLLVNVVSLS